MAGSTAGYISLMKSDDLLEGCVDPHYLRDIRLRVSVARVAGKIYAFGDLCTYDGAPLSAGLLVGTTLMCQCDGSQFDIANGTVLRGPAIMSLTAYEVLEENGEVLVRL